MATSTIARTKDGTVQITFTIPFDEVKKSRDKALLELARDVTVPGFRKGKAPPDRAKDSISEDKLVERTITNIFPKMFADAIKKNKIRPATYPKLEILSAQEDKPWEVRATTTEIPKIDLGNYKSAIKGALATSSIWTPKKGKEDKTKELSREEREQVVIDTLFKSAKFEVPEAMIKQETDSRLGQLLSRIEKLGLTLESYLSSVGKSVEELRKEYGEQANRALKLELVLLEIAEKEKIDVSSEDIDRSIKEAVNADSSMAEKLNTPEQRNIIGSALKKRMVIKELCKLRL